MHKVDTIELKPKNKYAEYLNQFQWDSDKSLPPHGMLNFVGQNGPEFIKKVNDVLGRHFGGRVKPFRGDEWITPELGGIAVLAVFQRSVSFDVGFSPLVDRPFAFFNARGEPRDVYAFGSWTLRQRESNVGAARVLAYQPQKKMALAIKTADPEEFVVALFDPNLKSIIAAVKETNRLLKNLPDGSEEKPVPPDSYITKDDTILLPMIQLNSLGHFEENLFGIYRIPNAPPNEYWRIVKAVQSIDFSLNHSGADMIVRTFVAPAIYLSTDIDEKQAKKSGPRDFVYNKPFFLMFWRKNASVPYLACYIETGGLVPTDKNPKDNK